MAVHESNMSSMISGAMSSSFPAVLLDILVHSCVILFLLDQETIKPSRRNTINAQNPHFNQ